LNLIHFMLFNLKFTEKGGERTALPKRGGMRRAVFSSLPGFFSYLTMSPFRYRTGRCQGLSLILGYAPSSRSLPPSPRPTRERVVSSGLDPPPGASLSTRNSSPTIAGTSPATKLHQDCHPGSGPTMGPHQDHLVQGTSSNESVGSRRTGRRRPLLHHPRPPASSRVFNPVPSSSHTMSHGGGGLQGSSSTEPNGPLAGGGPRRSSRSFHNRPTSPHSSSSWLLRSSFAKRPETPPQRGGKEEE